MKRMVEYNEYKKFVEDSKNFEKTVIDRLFDVAEDLTPLKQNYASEYHTIETIELVISPQEFVDNEYIVTNENFLLEGSLITLYYQGSLQNLEACSRSFIYLKEQQEDYSVTIACKQVPTSNVVLILKVELKGAR